MNPIIFPGLEYEHFYMCSFAEKIKRRRRYSLRIMYQQRKSAGHVAFTVCQCTLQRETNVLNNILNTGDVIVCAIYINRGSLQDTLPSRYINRTWTPNGNEKGNKLKDLPQYQKLTTHTYNKMKHCCCIPLLTLKKYSLFPALASLLSGPLCQLSSTKQLNTFYCLNGNEKWASTEKKSTGLLRAHIRAHMYKIEKDLCGTNFTKKNT